MMPSKPIFITITVLMTLTLRLTPCHAQDVQKLRIAALNCENLFDTLDTPGHQDEEFLPNSQKQWTSNRYWHKLAMLAREIASFAHTQPADIVALVEVEGDTALRDLTTRTRLREIHYKYISTHGSDPRGINVALLWQEGAFRPIRSRSICWQQRLAATPPTRDVLHVNGVARSGDTLDILVCHMPSQYGKRHARRLRRNIATNLRTYTDSLLTANPRANVIIVGDMNDSPDSRILRCHLGAQPLTHNSPTICSPAPYSQLYNISNLRANPHTPRGTYRYRGHWEMLDQCIVSARLTDANSHLHLAHNPVQIVSHNFLLEADKQYGGQKPWRTWLGPVYHGGFSDHLPIVIDFEYKR